MRSAAARLSIMPVEEQTSLQQEMRKCLGTTGLTLKTLGQMKQLDRVVNEASTVSSLEGVGWVRLDAGPTPPRGGTLCQHRTSV